MLTLFGIAFGVESIGNHILFRTYGLDLGIYAQTLYDHAHLRSNDGTFFLWSPSNQLGDHFDLMLALLAPLGWLVRADWLLLAVQIAAVLAAAWGTYRLVRHECGSESLSLLAMLLPLTCFGTWHALGFDYHSSVVAACLLPWLVYFVKRKRLAAASLTAALMAICKESSALWLCFVLPALMWDSRRDRRTLRWLAIAEGVAVAYTAAVTLLAMPALGGGAGFWRYSWMGNSFGEVARWLLTHPLQAVADIVRDFTPAGDSVALKREFLLCALASGLAITLFKPAYLLMLLPPLGLKMLAADPNSFWGITYHYNIEICMVCSVASAEVLCHLKATKLRPVLMATAAALTLGTTLYTTNRPLTPIRRAQVSIFTADHYRQRDFDVATARRMLAMVPADASVCAATMFTPHLAARDNAYIFPRGLANGAEYYLILPDHWSYYEGEAETAQRLIADTTGFRILLTDGTLYLLQAKPSAVEASERQ